MLCVFSTHLFMAITIDKKTEFYQDLLAQVKVIISNETDFIANMANISALLFDALTQVN